MPLELNAEQRRWLSPDRSSGVPIGRQLYLRLYEAIVSGWLVHGQQLPPSRTVSQQLSLARNSVVAAYNQLTAEGLLEASGRRGTTVCFVQPNPRPEAEPAWTLSRRGQHGLLRLTRPGPPWGSSQETVSALEGSTTPWPLTPGEPDSTLFPDDIWRQAMRHAAQLPATELGYRHGSVPELQCALARYLSTWRQLSVAPEQIVVTASTRQSLAVAASLFADVGDIAWAECPGYLGAVEAFELQGLRVQPCRIDEEGLMLSPESEPRLVYSTPCFQYPMGTTMSASRRADLLSLSARSGCVVFEDDYDSEFRDDSQPAPALASQRFSDSGTGHLNARVLHSGTFSKLLFPAARVAWMVVPRESAEAAHRCLRLLGGGSNTVAQSVVAWLLDEGHVTRHLQRARQVYRQRRHAFEKSVNRHSGVRMNSSSAGSLSAVVALDDAVDRIELEAQLQQAGLGAVPLERLDWSGSQPRLSHSLVVGLGNVDTLGIDPVVSRLCRAIDQSR